MSLLVCVYQIDWEFSKMDDLGFDRPIGPENWRHLFYGSDAVKSLGLKIVPTLAQTDIYAGGEDLELLESEIKTMQDNLAFIARETQGDVQDYGSRLEYIREAIEYAKPQQAHVVLW